MLHPADAARHGLSAGAPAELGDFADAPWLLPGPETACHEMARRACGAAGFVPRPVAVANDVTVLTALITRGAGVALIPRPALPVPSPELSVHTLNTPVRRSIQAVYHMGMGRRPDIGGTLDMPVSAAASEVPAGSRRP
ncbi:LysR substrate-binding domain-containing protein [Streptomyces sp. CoH27]|uniref:LysR substrate-binding domain-containing protein n=1 Tax=Streptomyces sp. CoH27 TaxID=2875763 RepID=UPI001CD4449E|nr:LysR substrate-binding domain-containing protein [Streptomyces sp. CoH27]